jgi:hypothetical protein
MNMSPFWKSMPTSLNIFMQMPVWVKRTSGNVNKRVVNDVTTSAIKSFAYDHNDGENGKAVVGSDVDVPAQLPMNSVSQSMARQI